MALPSTLVWEVRTTGSNNNGGAFKSGGAGTDYSQQNTAQKTGSDLTMHASDNTKVRPVAAGVAAADVDNVLKITAGTNWTLGRYHIVSQDGTYWTLDRSPAAAGESNTATYYMGGACATDGEVGSSAVGSNIIWVKLGTYTNTVITANVSNGVISLPAGTGTNPTMLIGYDTTRGDETANRPTLAVGVNMSYNARVTIDIYCTVRNLIIDGVGATYTNVRGLYTSSKYGSQIHRVKIKSCSYEHFYINWSPTLLSDCEFTDNLGTSNDSKALQCRFVRCWFHDSTNGNVEVTADQTSFEDCIFDTIKKSGGTQPAVLISSATAVVFRNCSFYNCTDDIKITNSAVLIENCHFEACSGYGINLVSSTNNLVMIINSSGYNNTSGNYDASKIRADNVKNFIAVTDGSVFVDAAGNNFGLNNTANRGALLRAAGVPGTWTGLSTTTGYKDIAAVQHQDAGGGTTNIFMVME